MPRTQREGTAPATDTPPKSPELIVIDDCGRVPEHVWRMYDRRPHGPDCGCYVCEAQYA